jgi:hypothetical protein
VDCGFLAVCNELRGLPLIFVLSRKEEREEVS